MNSVNEAYRVDVAETRGSAALYVAPELRVGRRLGEHLDLDVVLTVLVLAALSTPSWQDQHLVSTSPSPATTQGDGAGTFGSQSLVGSALVVFLAGFGVLTICEGCAACSFDNLTR